MSKAPEVSIPSIEAWAKAAAKSAPDGDISRLNWVTPEGLTVKPLYTRADVEGLPYADTLPGFAGMALRAGFELVKNWEDRNDLFSVLFLRVRDWQPGPKWISPGFDHTTFETISASARVVVTGASLRAATMARATARE